MAETPKRPPPRTAVAPLSEIPQEPPPPPIPVAEVVPVPVAPVGPRGINTTEFLLVAIVATVVVLGAVALLIWAPDPATRSTVNGMLQKLVEIAVGYAASRGLAKLGQGVASRGGIGG